jgi:hypothetical protein
VSTTTQARSSADLGRSPVGLFVVKGDLRHFYPRIAQSLARRHGWRVSAITFNTLGSAEVEKAGIFDRIYSLPAKLKVVVPRLEPPQVVERLRQYERRYSIPSLNTILGMDRILLRYPHERALAMLAGMFEFWEEVMADVRPDGVFGEFSTAAELIGWHVARTSGIHSVMPHIAPMPGRFFLLHDPSGVWEPMRRRYNEFRIQGLPAAAAETADAYIQRVRATREKPEFMRSSLRPPTSIGVSRLVKRAGRIPARVGSWLKDGTFEVGSYHGTNPLYSVAYDAARITRHIVAERTNFDPTGDLSNAVYYPLQSQPEYSLDVRAPFLTNQLAVIENIARSVPAGMRVVVKDHPEMQGRRPLAFYRAVGRIPNVSVLSPSVDSHELIARARAVVTITGTATWESQIYGKPAVLIGTVAYGFVDGLFKCASMSDLPDQIVQAIEAGTSNVEAVRCMVAALADTAYHGTFDDPIRQPDVADDRNVNAIADALQADLAANAGNKRDLVEVL